MATEWQRFTVDVPKGLSADEREAIADEVIDFIRDQAKAGRGITGTEAGVGGRRKDFPGYSKAYVESLNFKIAGKSKNEVNLTLSGDTLGAISLLGHKPGQLTIGFEKGSQENAIADGNIRGTYGTDSPDPKRARNFLGLTKKELELIIERVTPEDAEINAAAKRAQRRMGGSSIEADILDLDEEFDG